MGYGHSGLDGHWVFGSPGFALRLRASRVCLPASLAMTAQRHSSIMLAFVLSVMCFTLTATGGMAPRGLPSGLGAALELGWNGEIGAESWVAFPGFGSTAHCHGGLVGLDLLGLEGSAFDSLGDGCVGLEGRGLRIDAESSCASLGWDETCLGGGVHLDAGDGEFGAFDGGSLLGVC